MRKLELYIVMHINTLEGVTCLLSTSFVLNELIKVYWEGVSEVNATHPTEAI
jgi:hypothetical protein